MNKEFGKDLILKIQSQKAKWDADTRPLIDGSLVRAGAFDVPSDTIASVVRASETWQILQILYNLCIIHRPQFVLELGMNMGISTAYIAAALKALGGEKRIHTVDASPYKGKYAKEMHLALRLDNVDYTFGLFADVLNEVIGRCPTIDMAFIDGQHEYNPTMDFFRIISSKASMGAVLVFDDINGYSAEMDSAWAEIKRMESVFSWAEFGAIGWVILR